MSQELEQAIISNPNLGISAGISQPSDRNEPEHIVIEGKKILVITADNVLHVIKRVVKESKSLSSEARLELIGQLNTKGELYNTLRDFVGKEFDSNEWETVINYLNKLDIPKTLKTQINKALEQHKSQCVFKDLWRKEQIKNKFNK